jgi:trans-AT polyketide synthase/acyltransferase/oxidoreductase domain-containing protein
MIGAHSSGDAGLPLLAYVPALPAESLGDAGFRRDHGLTFAYAAGAMANGIASEQLVEAVSGAGMLAFFGAAGLSIERIGAALDRLGRSLGARTYGVDLIHSPNEPRHESATVALYLNRQVRLVSASAFLLMTVPLVRYRVSGIHRGADGRIVAPNQVIAKVSRVEVARQFLAPPPDSILRELVADGSISTEQAELATEIPMARDLTAEADSAGHTDNRPALALLPTMLTLAARTTRERGYIDPLRVGAAGGISTPAAVAAMFGMGAAFVMTGSVNQSCIEAGTSDEVRAMLAAAEQADTAMAPAADMFEMGVKVQVLKRGTMFAMRAARLYELYRNHDGLDSLPPVHRRELEKNYFKEPLEQAWQRTRQFFADRDPAQLERANRDPKHKMALLFRSYLGLSSRWANTGDVARRVDYQVWCGPAMGAFNEWAKGSFLADPQQRRVTLIARNLMHSAAVITRIQALRNQGIVVPSELLERRPSSAANFDEVRR